MTDRRCGIGLARAGETRCRPGVYRLEVHRTGGQPQQVTDPRRRFRVGHKRTLPGAQGTGNGRWYETLGLRLTLPMLSRRAVLILNPLSGSGMHQPTIRRAAWDRLIDVRELGIGYQAEVLARDAVREGAKVLVAAGGDGTVRAVARTAAEHDIPLVVDDDHQQPLHSGRRRR